MRSASLVLVIAATAACGSKKSNPPATGSGSQAAAGSAQPGGAGGDKSPAPTEADALWQLAPATAGGGVVVTGKALVLIDRALAFVNGLSRQLPGGAEVVEGLGEMRAGILGTATSYADAGLALDRGGALFFSGLDAPKGDPKKSTIVILPVADRAKFVATHGGTTAGDVDTIKDQVCKQIGPHYACAKTVGELVLGGGMLGVHAGVGGVRGDLEIVFDIPRTPSNIPLTPTAPLSAVVTVQRGEAIVRARLPATLQGPLVALAGAVPAAIDIDRAAGFMVLPFDTFKAMPDAPPKALEAFRAIVGPATAVIPAGVADVDVRMAVSDPKIAAGVLGLCDKIGDKLQLPAKSGPGTCTLGPHPMLGASATMWFEGGELRAARAKGPVAPGADGAPPSTTARELIGFTGAYWGRGTLIGEPLPPGLPLEATRVFAALQFVSEIGMGVKFTKTGADFLAVVRTIHANPDPVVAELEAAIGAGADRAKLAAIAVANPGTPIAADATAGSMGLMVPAAAVGIVAAIAIPAFIEYTAGGRKPEPDLALNRIAKTAKVFFVMNAAFPIGKTPLTPAVPCCEAPGLKCLPDPAPWTSDKVWSELEFMMMDPHYFQYRYEGTAKEFTATAVGDLDCDGAEITITARGTLDSKGNPQVELTRSGTD